MWIREIVIALYLVIHSLSVIASPIEVGLEDLISRSKKDHPESQIFEQQIQTFRAMQRGEVSLPNPMLSYEEMSSKSGMMKESKWEFKQKLPFPWKLYLSNEIYDSEIKSIEAESNQLKKTRIANLTIAFYRWLSLSKKLKIKNEQISLFSQLIEVQRTRYISQKVSQVEVVALQIERGNFLNEASMIEVEIADVKKQIEIWVGPGENLNKSEPRDEKLPIIGFRELNLNEISEKLDKNNSQLQSIEKQLEKSVKKFDRTKLGWVPDLELMLSEGRDEQGQPKSSWQIGIEIPLWFGADQRSKMDQSRSELTTNQLEYNELKRKLILECQSLLKEQQQTLRQLDLMENGLVLWSHQNVKLARMNYQTGKLEYGNFLALMQSAYQTVLGYEDLKVKVLENHQKLSLIIGDH